MAGGSPLSGRRLRGLGTKQGFLAPAVAFESTLGKCGLMDFSPADQVVEVGAGMAIADLQALLGAEGQCLPLPDPAEWGAAAAGYPGTVGGLLACNLPHGYMAACGMPRDWVLGAILRRPDGSEAKSGSRAVKSVAGYDAHKLGVGTWGRGLMYVRVILRTFPTKGLPAMSIVQSAPIQAPVFIQRCLRSDFDSVLRQTPGVVAHDPQTQVIWSQERPSTPPEGWVIGPGGYRARPAWMDEAEAAFLSTFDPEGVWI